MKHVLRVLSAGLLAALVSTANAGTINFIQLIQNPAASGGLGEGAWTSLNLSSGGVSFTVTGHATNDNDPQQYVYLDWGNAGIGVCKDVAKASLVNKIQAGNQNTNCNPSSDDNVTSHEFLRFVFNHDVIVNKLWFNNNHDGGFHTGDKININGNLRNAITGYAGDSHGIGSFFVKANTNFDVSFYNQEFYIDAIQVTATTPEASALIMLSIGLLGLVATRRKVQ